MSNTVSRRGLLGMFAAGFAALPVGATAQRLNIINNTTGPVRAVEWQDLPNGERAGVIVEAASDRAEEIFEAFRVRVEALGGRVFDRDRALAEIRASLSGKSIEYPGWYGISGWGSTTKLYHLDESIENVSTVVTIRAKSYEDAVDILFSGHRHDFRFCCTTLASNDWPHSQTLRVFGPPALIRHLASRPMFS